MSTGTPFAPTPFSTSYVTPQAQSLFRRASYITPSEFRYAPTAVGTQNLTAKSANPQVDSTASLAQTIARASGWVDLICFHRADGSFAASTVTEQMWARAKPDGALALICNYKPVLEVTGLALGPVPSQVQDVSSTVADNLWLEDKVLMVPALWNSAGPWPVYFSPTGPGGGVFAVWTYVAGYPHTTLAAACAAGAQTISLNSSSPDGTTVQGVYEGSALQIVDGASTETVVASAAPDGLTLSLASGLAYAHNPPPAPDGIRVSAIPWAVEQATLSLAAVLIKARGTRAFQFSQTAGGTPSEQEIAEAGATDDYQRARQLLKPLVAVYLH